MKFPGRLAVRLAGMAVLAALTGLAGCGGGSGLAPVKGKIMHQGQPVKGGSITFQPIGGGDARAGNLGKPATAVVTDDGTFVLSSYGKGDGAVVGKHRVAYLPIFLGAKDYNDKPPPSPYVGLVLQPNEVEVKPGSNEISLELVAGPANVKPDAPTPPPQ